MEDTEPNNSAIARSATTKASWRLLPLLGLAYLIAYMDRVNISFAAAQMNADLHFSATIYGLGGGLFFLSYSLFEVPSNVIMMCVGPRRWLARIMISWGILAAAMMLVRTPMQFYVLRFLIGMAEAGFFPCVVYYIAHWFPQAHRGRAISRFYLFGPLASVVMGVFSNFLLGMNGMLALRGWQWLLLIQGLPAVFVGIIILCILPDAPATARWLTDDEKAWLSREIDRDAARIGEPESHSVMAALRDPLVVHLALISICTIAPFYAFTLSAPQVLMAASGYDTQVIGYAVSLGGIVGATTMALTGWLSDRRGDRFSFLLTAMVIESTALAIIAWAPSPVAVMLAYLLFAAAWTPVTLSQVMIWADVFHVRRLAICSAAINSVAQIGAFVSPYGFGMAKDATGSYTAGMLALPLVTMLGFVLAIPLMRKLNGGRVAVAVTCRP